MFIKDKTICCLWSKLWWYWQRNDDRKIIAIKGWNCALVEDSWGNRYTIMPDPLATLKYKWEYRKRFHFRFRKKKHSGGFAENFQSSPSWINTRDPNSTEPW